MSKETYYSVCVRIEHTRNAGREEWKKHAHTHKLTHAHKTHIHVHTHTQTYTHQYARGR